MSGFPWLPLGYALSKGAVGRLLEEGDGYQIVQNRGLDSVFLLIENGTLVARAINQFDVSAAFDRNEFGGKEISSAVFEKGMQPIVIREWPKQIGLLTPPDAARIAQSIVRLRRSLPTAEIATSLFLPALDMCLPVKEAAAREDLRSLAFLLLVGGAPAEFRGVESVRSLNSWLTVEEIQEFFAAFDVSAEEPRAQSAPLDLNSFSLPGRPELESFFLEYVLEPTADRERYQAFGVKMPNGILLYGPPGSGKSHTVKKLVTTLGWPLFEIDLGSMGSPFIHQTSVALKKAFDEAKRSAPALIVLEEIDALATSRGPMMHDHKVEEVAELLRLVETAGENKILVIATTNRVEALDPAIRRKGRFDHAIEVGYPTEPEVRAAIDSLLNERPHKHINKLDRVARSLAGRPMSDVAWVVNESARLAARAKKTAIEEDDVLTALKSLKIDLAVA